MIEYDGNGLSTRLGIDKERFDLFYRMCRDLVLEPENASDDLLLPLDFYEDSRGAVVVAFTMAEPRMSVNSAFIPDVFTFYGVDMDRQVVCYKVGIEDFMRMTSDWMVPPETVRSAVEDAFPGLFSVLSVSEEPSFYGFRLSLSFGRRAEIPQYFRVKSVSVVRGGLKVDALLRFEDMHRLFEYLGDSEDVVMSNDLDSMKESLVDALQEDPCKDCGCFDECFGAEESGPGNRELSFFIRSGGVKS